MKNFLAIYIGSPDSAERSGWNKLSDAQRKARQAEGINAWIQWSAKHAAHIVDQGSPLGKTKRAAPEGLSDIKNVMAAYTVVRAESHEAAAKLFEQHPHFTIFPDDSVEIMECLPIPMR